MLSDCPEAQKAVMDKDVLHAGHCFKCGSDEHTSKECNSKRKGADAFAFAVCFICKESGHLAKACPDNPKGLYPKGGGCRFCGSVEHLKSECPRKGEKDARTEVRAGTIGRVTKDVDDLGEATFGAKRARPQQPQKMKKKVVNF